jgi:DNA repair protein RecO
LILRRFPFGETSLVLHVVTREHGRVHLLAKGAYRPKSRYWCVLDLFDTLNLEWNHAARRELQLLQAGSIDRRRHRIADDLSSYRAALTALELTELGAQEAQPCPELFDLLARTLDRMLPQGPPPDLALVVFELAFLESLGLSPALTGCAACGGPAPPATPPATRNGPPSEERVAFSAGAGGRLCEPCAAEARRSGRRVGTLPTGVLEAAQRLSRPEALTDTDAAPGAGELESLRDFVARFLEYHLQGRPKSYREFLRTPNRNQPKQPLPAASPDS